MITMYIEFNCYYILKILLFFKTSNIKIKLTSIMFFLFISRKIKIRLFTIYIFVMCINTAFKPLLQLEIIYMVNIFII